MINFQEIVVAGVTLIRDSIQSPNYVAGVSGWTVNKDGSVEFNIAVIRGTLIAGGGAVTVDSGGVKVVGTGGTLDYEINRTAGFIARNLPDNGGVGQLFVGGMGLLQAAGSTVSDGVWTAAATLFSSGSFSGGENFPFFIINSGAINSQSQAAISMSGEGSQGIQQPFIQLNADTVGIQHKMLNTDTSFFYLPMQAFTVTINVAIGDNNIALGNTNYPLAFPAGRTVFGMCNINTSNAASSLWYSRFIPVSVTQFNVIVSRPANATAAAALVVEIIAFVIPA